MVASRLRLENISIFNYIKHEVISPAFSERIQDESLVFNLSTGAYEVSSTMEPSPVSGGRGWVFFDDYDVNGRLIVDTAQEQISKVVVNGATTYDVNYLNGSILNPDTTPTSVSYYWNYVGVLPSWPGTTPPPLPFVSMDIEKTTRTGFQLGGGSKNIRTLYFDVFASSAAERDDISDTIHGALFNRTITIRDYEEGGYLNYDGTFNTSVLLPLTDLGNLYFIDVQHKNTHSVDWTDINKFRSVISGTYESFVDSV